MGNGITVSLTRFTIEETGLEKNLLILNLAITVYI